MQNFTENIDENGYIPKTPNSLQTSFSITEKNLDNIENQNNRRRFKTHVSAKEFRQKMLILKDWFREFNDDQRNIVLKNFLEECHQPQIHLLSMKIGSHLHSGCQINCQDPFQILPKTITLLILSYLDAVTLCHASSVNSNLNQLCNSRLLWKRLCLRSKWCFYFLRDTHKYSRASTDQHNIDWKNVFVERFKLQRNWMKGRCNVRTFEGHTQGISCLQFDETRIVSGSSDNTIKVWNIRTNSPWAAQTLVGHSAKIRCLHLNGNKLVSGSSDLTIKVWDLSSEEDWASIACKVTMIGHSDIVRCLKAGNNKVISGSYDKTLKIWNIKTGNCLQTLRGHTAAVLCVHFDEIKIISGSSDKTIKIWSSEGSCLTTLFGHQDSITCLQFDDTRIITGSLDCSLRFWDIRTGKCLKIIDWQASEGHTRVVRCLQLDKWRVISASDDKTMKVWCLETGNLLVTLQNHTDGVTCLQFNDKVIVSGSYDKTIKLWDFSCC